MKRIFLLAGTVGWGIAVLGVLLPWNLMDRILRNMGAVASITDPQIQYWFRMATGSWSIIGFFFLAVLLRPEKYENLIPLLAGASIFEGVILLIHGMMLQLPWFPFAGDVVFCLLVGAGLLAGNQEHVANYALLAGRSPDASPWHFSGIDGSIVAAYLELIAGAFFLNRPSELFKLRPEDSLTALYNSRERKNRFLFLRISDNRELTEVALGLKALCEPLESDFLEDATIREQLQEIAKARGNRPISPEERKKLRLDLHFLPSLAGGGR